MTNNKYCTAVVYHPLVATLALMLVMPCMKKNFQEMFKNQFINIVQNGIILFLCSICIKVFIVLYFYDLHSRSLGDIFGLYSRMLLISALLHWQPSGSAYFTFMVDCVNAIACNCCVAFSLHVLVMHFQNFMTSLVIII